MFVCVKLQSCLLSPVRDCVLGFIGCAVAMVKYKSIVSSWQLRKFALFNYYLIIQITKIEPNPTELTFFFSLCTKKEKKCNYDVEQYVGKYTKLHLTVNDPHSYKTLLHDRKQKTQTSWKLPVS